ncbi:MAG: TadE/TadG family type IV pilus assembly protein, partial [Planctomycetaceae bacterium]
MGERDYKLKNANCKLQFSILRRLHRDERGTVSIMTVFALFLFTILLVKLVNVGRHVDDKVRMQNAADAGAYSGGVVMARGMNTLAFTNHLEAEVFALAAYMRTAQMRDDEGNLVVESLTPDVLDKWEEIGKVFRQYGGQAGYAKFEKLGKAIEGKVPLERGVVSGFSEMTARHAELTLPVLEYILHAGEADASGGSFGSVVDVPEGGIIPRFQRALVRSVPQVANLTANELAIRYGRPGEPLRRMRRPMQGRMWRTDAVSFGAADESDPLMRTLPAIDPSPTGSDGPPNRQYYDIARRQREALAKHYLELWIRDWMGPYFAYAGRNRPGRSTAKMSQFINLWRTLACGHLKVLLDLEYPNT